MRLNTYINSLNFSTQLELVNKLLDSTQDPKKVQTHVTFWGTRVVTVQGYTGSVSIESLSSKILQVGSSRSTVKNLTPAQRLAGTEIVDKLDKFYRLTDAQIKNSNFFTRFLSWFREFSFYPYTTRFYIEETAYFLEYNVAQYKQHFGEDPPQSQFMSSTIIVERERLRALLAR